MKLKFIFLFIELVTEVKCHNQKLVSLLSTRFFANVKKIVAVFENSKFLRARAELSCRWSNEKLSAFAAMCVKKLPVVRMH